jgi:hypothetical protein
MFLIGCLKHTTLKYFLFDSKLCIQTCNIISGTSKEGARNSMNLIQPKYSFFFLQWWLSFEHISGRCWANIHLLFINIFDINKNLCCMTYNVQWFHFKKVSEGTIVKKMLCISYSPLHISCFFPVSWKFLVSVRF